MKIKVASFQMDIAFGQESMNIKKALLAIDSLFNREAGIHFLSFPELLGTGFDYNYLRSLTLSGIESSFKRIIKAFSEKAIKYNVYIQLGSILEAKEGKVYNSAPLIDPQGNLLGTYHKQHLFPLMDEAAFFSPGNELNVFTTDLAKIGIAICFDVRFPTLFRELALKGAEIIFVPAQFPAARIKHVNDIFFFPGMLELPVLKNKKNAYAIARQSWGGRIRTCECRRQRPMPYLLATPHHSVSLSLKAS